MNPTIVCNNYITDQVDLTYEEFGSVVLSNGGSISSILRCDAGTSSAIALSTDSGYLTSEDFSVLWPSLTGLMVMGFIAQRLIRVVS